MAIFEAYIPLTLLRYLAELGSVFYSVKEKNFDDRGNRRVTDREFSKKAELETEMARQREEYVVSSEGSLLLICRSLPRTAKQLKEEELATQISKGSASKIIVPGTPKHTGIGAGARVIQTPRRRVGI